MEKLRKIIQEMISEALLSEDYDSIAEIQTLSNSVLMALAIANFEYVKRQVAEGGNSIHFYPVSLLDVYQEDPKKFPKLQQFLTNSKIQIQLIRSVASTVKGNYSYFDDENYDSGRSRTIRLMYGEHLEEKIRKKAEETYKDLYVTFWFEFHSTLEHEIQHAFDDFRSNSKLFKNKNTEKYNQSYIDNGEKIASSNENEEYVRYKKYLRLQHEIWARFTQTINELKFTSGDFAETPNGGLYILHEMKPLQKVIKDFQSGFNGWAVMTEKTKRNLLARVSQYWHKVKENLPKRNEDAYNKALEYKKDNLSEIRETVRQTLETLQEDYPSSFDINTFKALTSFKDRVEYCNANLKRLGSGSSRIVYQIDEGKVLKLAKNKKGIVQNEGEVDAFLQSYYSNIAEVFEYDENGLWVEMELARKVSPAQFKVITGFDINDVRKYLQAFQNSTQGRSTAGFYLEPGLEKAIMEDPFVDSLRDFIANTDALAGDIGTISSFGLVNRGGEDTLVLVDFGLAEADYNELYREGLVSENNTKFWVNGGILLIKGKPFMDGTFPLYAVHIVDLKELPRKKVDNTDGKSAKMAILDNNLFRIVIDNGMLRAMKVDTRTFGSLSRTMNFNGRQTHAVTLNNNKTPIHWETLQSNNFPMLFQKSGQEIQGIPNIKWTLS